MGLTCTDASLKRLLGGESRSLRDRMIYTEIFTRNHLEKQIELDEKPHRHDPDRIYRTRGP